MKVLHNIFATWLQIREERYSVANTLEVVQSQVQANRPASRKPVVVKIKSLKKLLELVPSKSESCEIKVPANETYTWLKLLQRFSSVNLNLMNSL